MQCPHCESIHTKELKRTTGLGYLQFFCRDCAFVELTTAASTIILVIAYSTVVLFSGLVIDALQFGKFIARLLA